MTLVTHKQVCSCDLVMKKVPTLEEGKLFSFSVATWGVGDHKLCVSRT